MTPHSLAFHSARSLIACLAAGDDCVAVEFAFDNGTTLGTLESTMGACSENMNTLVWLSGGTAYEGAFLKATSGGACFSAGGIFFAEHRN